MTDEVVPPLDAYATAKPDEPIWTVQGGDPLGGPLLRIWAVFARIRAGVIKGGETNVIFEQILKAANKNPPENEREKDDLLVRATLTEQISWDMDAYRKGNHHVEQEEEVAPIALDRIDLHDLKVRAAQKLSSFRGELNEIREALQKAGYTEQEPLSDLKTAIYNLGLLKDMIEPRRLFRKD